MKRESYNSDEGDLGAFPCSFNSNSFSVPSKYAADSHS